jgi:hypothetical protein
MVKTNRYPCGKCLKGIIAGKEKLLEYRDGRFTKVVDPKGDIWQFGPDCFKAILRNNGKKDW